MAHEGEPGAATGLNYDRLVEVLVEAVKEQQAELDRLKKEQQLEKEGHQAESASMKAEMQQLKALLQEKQCRYDLTQELAWCPPVGDPCIEVT